MLAIRRVLSDRLARTLFISYPKSGRTWLRMMLGTALIAHFEIDDAKTRRISPASSAHASPQDEGHASRATVRTHR